jgi:acyl-CoA reductase-like NAD-dependent aldehyde dehydrogenase
MTDIQSKPQLTIIEARNPADGRFVSEVPVHTPETVAAKVRELRLYQPEWEALGPRGRGQRRPGADGPQAGRRGHIL